MSFGFGESAADLSDPAALAPESSTFAFASGWADPAASPPGVLSFASGGSAADWADPAESFVALVAITMPTGAASVLSAATSLSRSGSLESLAQKSPSGRGSLGEAGADAAEVSASAEVAAAAVAFGAECGAAFAFGFGIFDKSGAFGAAFDLTATIFFSLPSRHGVPCSSPGVRRTLCLGFLAAVSSSSLEGEALRRRFGGG